MSARRWPLVVGFGLLAGCFAWSIAQVARHGRPSRASAGVTLRVAHQHLEPGLREAFEEVFREYESRHPGVHLEQIAVPNRAYASWFRIQLVGETTPDIMELPANLSGFEEIMAAYLLPFGDRLDEPNPYNTGTDLALVPWRETFIDNLEGSYNRLLSDYYRIPNAFFTTRVFYNRTLWRRLLGGRPEPRTWAEFRAVCTDATRRARQEGLVIAPIAGSKFNAQPMLDSLFASQTQQLSLALDRNHDWEPSKFETSQAFLQGQWSLATPDVRRGFALVREASQFMPPGFQQMARDDATFYFGQQRALMISSYAADAPAMFAVANFDIGIFRLPLPDRDDPDYGSSVLGPSSEINLSSAAGVAGLGVLRRGPQVERAVDFVQFLSSRLGNRIFSERSRWIPVIRGVEPAPELRPFAPVVDGYMEGITPSFGRIGRELQALYDRNAHRLLGPQGGVDQYLAAIAPDFRPAMLRDLAATAKILRRTALRYDTALAALWMEQTHWPDRRSAARFAETAQVQEKYEDDIFWIELQLTEAAAEKVARR